MKQHRSGLRGTHSRAARWSFASFARASIALLVATVSCLAPTGAGDQGGQESFAERAEGLSTVSVTQAGDELRSGWYSDEPGLAPTTVGGTNFGQLFSTAVNGQVYAQPLVWNGHLLVATETNNVYGLDPVTGAIQWQTNLGTPFNASDLNCGDLTPTMGITGTPVIDQTSGTAYLFAKTYVTGTSGAAVWHAHALDMTTGHERTGFPVLISGAASNDATQVFSPITLNQRPGLLLRDGVVYAGFGGICDKAPWAGWVVGVSSAGVLTTLWTTEAGPNKANGAGVWMSGSGLMSDGTGQIVLTTGNSYTLGTLTGAAVPGTTPPQVFGEAIVRLAVQSNGSLKATDFFSPYDAQMLDSFDGDLGSGGAIGLPPAYFGTATYPNLFAQVGKQGYLYLLDGNHLGGFANGAGGGDAVVSRIGPDGGVWGRPAVWPGDGGYLYVSTSSSGTVAIGPSGYFHVYKYGLDGTGKPVFSKVATSSDAFGFGSSPAVVTSNGTQSGSALVWVVWSATGAGTGAQLRAYDPVPVNGVPNLRYSAAIGTSSKFNAPGVANGRVYVGTRDGNVIAFGSPVQAPLTGSGYAFGSVIQGTSKSTTLTLTANAPVSATSVVSSNADFVVGATTPTLPASLVSGGTLQIPVTFKPSTIGLEAATLTINTAQGVFSLALSGTGESPNAVIAASPNILSMGGTAPGGQIVSTVTFSNVGGAPLTINAVDSPAAPFTISGAPAVGAQLASGASITLTVTFSPTVLGTYADSVSLATTAGTGTVQLSGSCTPPAVLTITPITLPYQEVGVGSTKTGTFTLTNTGGSTLTITKSKPPSLGQFTAVSTLPEGTTLAAGATAVETVAFTPTQAGPLSDGWTINSTDATGVRTVSFNGTGATDLTPATAGATIIALVTAPTGSGSKNLEVIRDGVYPPVGTTDTTLQYDTYTGVTRTEDWIGYSYATPQTFGSMVFQDGRQFSDGGWFTTVRVQVRQAGTWVTVPGATITPAYAGNNGVYFQTYVFTFPAITGDGIRIDGQPGGSATFFSTGELRVFAPLPPSGAPTANAGPNQKVAPGAAVTLDGSGSTDPKSLALTYAWTQTAGPTVTLSSATAVKPTFTAPTVTAATTLTFSLVVSDGTLSSAASTVNVTVAPPPKAPTANAGTSQTVAAGATVILNGSGSTDPNGLPLTYAWTQTAGPAVTLSSATAQQPTFTAPQVTASTTLTFSLVVSDADLSSSAATVGVTVTPGPPDITANATIIALITSPQGSGSKSLEVIRDGVYPPVGSTSSTQQYDTYTGATRTEDWIGYSFATPQTFGSMVFQDGMQFGNGGWFTTLNVQVRQSGTWVNVPGVTFTPAYKGNDGVNFETYDISFPPITGDGIRLDGAPGGAATFISVGELRVFSVPPASGSPTANAGVNQTAARGATVTLDGSGSTDPKGAALTYTWEQTGGPAVTLSSTAAVKPTFTAPQVVATTALTFELTVSNATLSSAPATVTVTVTGHTDLTASSAGATIIALITAPTGGGNKNLEVIRDGVFPPVGSTDSSLQYDTYTGATRTEDWIGYSYTASQTFGAVVFEDGKQFSDGGWFTTLHVQVRQSGVWVNVPSVTVAPAYAGHDGVNFETYTFTFPSIAGDGIRIDGQPGGAATFISVGELRVYGP